MNKYDFYIALIDQDPLLAKHTSQSLQNHIAHYTNKRVHIVIQKSLHDVLTMPGAQLVQLCIVEPFHDLINNSFSPETSQSHKTFMKENTHISFIMYSQFSDPEKRYMDKTIPYYLKGAQQDDLFDHVTQLVNKAHLVT